MTIGLGSLLHSAWRENAFAPAVVEVVPANYGTAGSRAHWRDRRTDTVIAPTAGQDPRLPRYNGLIPTVFRLRVLDDAKLAAVAQKSPRPFGAPVTFAPPRTASLARLTPPSSGGSQK
jgi:hypothetical protein